MKTCWFVFLLISAGSACAGESPLAAAIDAERAHHEAEWLQEYVGLLAIPNVAADKADIRRNAEYIVGMMKRRGIAARLLEGDSPAANPAVFGEVRARGASRTLVLYAHYDGQPVNPAKWAPGLAPFAPVLITAPVERGGTVIGPYAPGMAVPPGARLAARSSADDKAGVMTILNAYAALVAIGHVPRVNLKFFFEGEEEEGSTHLDEILARHRELLAADLWVIADGPRHVLGNPVVDFGVRGDVNVALTVYGPKRPLHSGNYGNWAPNPAQRLTTLLAGMKDEHDHVTIAGYYDDVVPLSASERAAIARMPDLEPALKAELGIARPDGDGAPIGELLTRPTLNINGIQSGDVGAAASNVIPTRADAVLDLRLAKGNTLERQVGRVIRHIEAQGYHVVDHEPSDAERQSYDRLIRVSVASGYDAQRTPLDLPIARDTVAAVQSASAAPVVQVVSAGGSLPLILIERRLGTNVISVPVVNYDNNQHAENENVDIRYLWEGIATMAAVMSIR
jgi:acetylornithine deacetylase/succinyl-diaminopimelate desuccinylase-like protein